MHTIDSSADSPPAQQPLADIIHRLPRAVVKEATDEVNDYFNSLRKTIKKSYGGERLRQSRLADFRTCGFHQSFSFLNALGRRKSAKLLQQLAVSLGAQDEMLRAWLAEPPPEYFSTEDKEEFFRQKCGYMAVLLPVFWIGRRDPETAIQLLTVFIRNIKINGRDVPSLGRPMDDDDRSSGVYVALLNAVVQIVYHLALNMAQKEPT